MCAGIITLSYIRSLRTEPRGRGRPFGSKTKQHFRQQLPAPAEIWPGGGPTRAEPLYGALWEPLGMPPG